MNNNHISNAIEIEDDKEEEQRDMFELIDAKPRQIIFCVDVSTEMVLDLNASGNSGAALSNLYNSSRIETTKRFLKRYINMNTMIGNIRDKYGIIFLRDQAIWGSGFMPDQPRLKDQIDYLESEVDNSYSTFDTQSLYDLIAQKVNLKDNSYFAHVIVIYARTDVVPDFIDKGKNSHILQSPNYAMDVIFMHNKTDNPDNMQTVYDFWSDLESDIGGWYYEFSSMYGKEKLTRAMTELIAHPLLRGDQELIAKPTKIRR